MDKRTLLKNACAGYTKNQKIFCCTCTVEKVS